MKKWKKAMGIGLILTTAVCLSGCGKTTIDLNNYFESETSGSNGYGIISQTINYDSIIQDNANAFGLDNSTTDENLFGAMGAYGYVSGLRGEWDKNEGLSNGDKVVFSWDEDTIKTIESNYKVKIKHSDITVTINGLPEVESYDAFAGLEVTYESLAPFGTVSLNKSSCEIPDLEYIAEPSTGLQNGDEITVTVTVPNDCAQKYGKVPKKATKTYKVEGLMSFVTTAADIPEETMHAMKKQAEDVEKANSTKWSKDEKLNSMTYLGNYFLTMKDAEAQNENLELGSDYNITYLIYQLDITNSEGNYTCYWFCKFYDIVFLADGTCSVDTSDYHEPSTLFGKRVYLGQNHYYAGYQDKDSLFSDCVTHYAAEYDYENNLDSEQATDTKEADDSKQKAASKES